MRNRNKDKDSEDEEIIQGITTAATIWIVSAIGLAVGLGFYYGAVFTAIITLIILSVFNDNKIHKNLDRFLDKNKKTQ